MTQVRFLYASRINNKMTKKTKEAIAMYNAIFLRRANKVLTPESTSGFADTALIATALKNLESLGYVLSKDVIVDLLMTSDDEVVSFATEVTTALKELLGDNVTHRPMYPNFPQQVMEASSAELYLNALLHYFGSAVGLTILPVYDKVDRPALTHTKPLTVIQKGTEREFAALLKALASSKIAYSDLDRKDLTTALLETSYVQDVPNKENLAFLATLRPALYTSQFKTATDILRYLVALSDGDISLAAKTKFKKFKKSERREILGLLESLDNGLTEDMLRYKSEWKRVGEILHPGEYAKRFPKVAESFNIIRNDLPFETFNSKTERLIKEGDAAAAALHLANRPGEFARRLDKLLRLASDHLGLSQVIINQFNSVAAKVSSSVLLQTRAHFVNRDNLDSLRVFFPKGNISKFAAVEDKRKLIEARHSLAVVEVCTRALATIYAERELEPLGKVFIDPELRGYLIPFGNRSASANKHTLARGTRMAIPEGDTLRFFTHWKNTGTDPWGGRVDIDLSAGMLDKDFKTQGALTYYNLRDANGVHSGDITDAPDGASEFIDVSIKKALSNGIRYIYMSILSYTRQSFSEIPELFAGFMIRTAPGSGEIYDPRTVENKVDITVDSTNAVPFIIDLENREVIWTDMSMPSANYRPNNVASNKNGLELLSEALVTRKAPTMYDLFSIHAQSRGALVDTREGADTVFALDGDVTPFDAEIILSEYV